MINFTANTTPETSNNPRDVLVGSWLLVMCAMVLVMVVIGGVTRLTHSGLSMVDWRPITGWMPPLNPAEWKEAFALYRETPEFKKVNIGINMEGFKSIFWLEYIHRLWGRVIGVALLVPFFYFLFRGWLNRCLFSKIMFIFVLGVAQGLLGWFMVKSGLVERPDVSQYRLTGHLGLAVIIYGYMFWTALGLLRRQTQKIRPVSNGLRRLTAATLAWLFLTILAGGLVAGLDAGFTYNTFPLMDGRLVPDGLFRITPVYLNFFENVTTVQFEHRITAALSIVLMALLWWQARKEIVSIRARLPFNVLGALMLLQFGVGIATLILVIPVPVAAAHQAGAFLLVTAGLWALDSIRIVKMPAS